MAANINANFEGNLYIHEELTKPRYWQLKIFKNGYYNSAACQAWITYMVTAGMF
jgi:hypothetical protein